MAVTRAVFRNRRTEEKVQVLLLILLPGKRCDSLSSKGNLVLISLEVTLSLIHI